MAKNKAFVCFCVDGQSDIDALSIQFEELFDEIGGDDINVSFRYSKYKGENHGDITTLKGVEPDNIDKMIYKYYFKDQDRNSDLGWNDVTHIIHIIDLDGAYVKDEDIREFDETEENMASQLDNRDKEKRVLYLEDHIAVRPETASGSGSHIQQVCERNKRKRRLIEHLLTLESVTVNKKVVNYELYYFSSNLDHFLYGDANLSGSQKMRKAADFSAFYGDGESFCQFFEDSEFSCKTDYDSSWKVLRKGNVSIARGSNVNLLIEKIKGSSVEDWL